MEEIDLQLNPLDNEVFVVTGMKIDFLSLPVPQIGAGVPDVSAPHFECSVYKSRPATAGDISRSNVVGSSRIMSAAWASGAPAELNMISYLENSSMDSPPASMDYLDIIATNNYFISVDSFESPVVQARCAVRLYGYRARADASTYAALVQSELLSA